jgi:hypothetical protein
MAFGSNYFGQPYWGQGAAEAEALQFQTVSATVTTTASITSRTIVNKIVEATVVTTASITKQFQRILSATVTATGSLGTTITIPALNVVRGITKFLTARTNTRSLNEATSTEPLGGFRRTSRRIREE